MTPSRILNHAHWIARLSIVVAVAMLSACVYRIPIQQGNFLDSKDIDQVNVGMTRSQVRYLLGTPMVADPFDNSRWDYVYYFKYGRMREPMRRHFVVYFDGEKVARIERPIDDFNEAEQNQREAEAAEKAAS